MNIFYKLYTNKLISIYLAFFGFFLSTSIVAQSFVDINAGLTGVTYSSAAWGDFDNDHDLDLIVSGATSSDSYRTKIYRNEDGNFTEVATTITGMGKGSVSWGDYDNDTDLDILITDANDEEKTLIYKNVEGNFEEVDPGFYYAGSFSHGTWADYDNDGDLDVFLSGSWQSILYRNDGNDQFNLTENTFAMLSSSAADWADFDRDGDLDLILTGDTGGGMITYLYINDDGAFLESILPIIGLSGGSIEWGDYDNDGDLDILTLGFDDFVAPEVYIFRNDGDGQYVNIDASLFPVAAGNATWGDYDNDGDLDVALTGKCSGCGVLLSAVYENQGNDQFQDINAGLADAEFSHIAWGDFDGDTDLDLILTGGNYSGSGFAKIYRNDAGLPNIVPEKPTNLQSEIIDDDVILSWDKAFDAQTPQDALTYNLCIGTDPELFDLMSPMAMNEDGYRKIVSTGNTSPTNFWKITGLTEGITYYWTVQTIDHTFHGSPFADVQSFTFLATEILDQTSAKNFSIHPNPASEVIYIDSGESYYTNLTFKILSVTGETLLSGKTENKSHLDISGLPNGIYFLHLPEYPDQTVKFFVTR
jgi:hypothetical protein